MTKMNPQGCTRLSLLLLLLLLLLPCLGGLVVAASRSRRLRLAVLLFDPLAKALI